ncbi:recombinase family protein [[Clostridium] innocuum]|nr:recombinase family protein [[Clostridium] innocuum]
MIEQRRPVNIQVIPAKAKDTAKKKKNLRVAPYCRVSTDNDEQQRSYEIQVKAYTDQVNAHPGWELVKVFADDGISGTSKKKRNDFNEMVEMALNGEIDMIITKSVSRFARNTVDALDTIRQLRAKGVDIFFEKDNVHTLSQKGDFLVTILSSQAEAESYNISESIKWGKRKKMKHGQARMSTAFFGFTRDEKTDEIIFVEDEAETIRMIFRLFLSGYSLTKIGKELKRQGRKKRNGDASWQAAYLKTIIMNEKYCGDWLTQKTYVPDFLTHRSVKNNGVLDQYYYEDHHPGIVSKEMFKQAQLEMNRRESRLSVGARGTHVKGAYAPKYVLSSLLKCRECGNPYSRVHWSHRHKVVWRCMSRIRYGKRYCHDSPSIEEKRLQQEILNALKGILGNQDVFIRQIIKEYEELLCKMPDKDDVEAMKQEVENLKLKATSQIMQGMNENVPAELLDVKIEELSHKAKEIEIRMKQVGEKEVLENVYKERRKELEDVLHQLNGIALEWNEDMIRTVIDSIDVIDSTEIMITLKSGHVIQHTWEVKKK